MTANLRTRAWCLLEVGIVFSLAVLLFRLARSAPLVQPGSFLLPAYAVLLVAAGLVYLIRLGARPFPFAPGKLRFQGSIIAYGFFPVFLLSIALNWLDWKGWTGAALVSLLALLMLCWFAWMSRSKPAWQAGVSLSGCLVLGLTPHDGSGPAYVLLAIFYFYLFVGFAEEMLFRGYILERLNSVFGRPWQLLGIPWGLGVIISSVFFGLWHLDWAGLANWPQVLWTACAGLLFGIIREKSDSIIAPAILHGVLNFGPQAILFALLSHV